MKRPRLRVTVEGAPGPRGRVLQSLREMGYEIKEEPPRSGSKLLAAQVLAPHGEV